MIELLSQAGYAKKRGVTRQAVNEAMRKGKMHLLPGVEKVDRIIGEHGKCMYILTFNPNKLNEDGKSIGSVP